MTATVNLSIAASRVMRAVNDALEMSELDARFDGGEFSGRNLEQRIGHAVEKVLAEAGWTWETFEAAVIERTGSGAWLHKTGLDYWAPQYEECWTCHTRQRVVGTLTVNRADPTTAYKLACDHYVM